MVRGRALADLAEVVDCFAALLAQDPFSEQHQVAEAFVEGLGAAAALQVRHVTGRRCGSACQIGCYSMVSVWQMRCSALPAVRRGCIHTVLVSCDVSLHTMCNTLHGLA